MAKNRLQERGREALNANDLNMMYAIALGIGEDPHLDARTVALARGALEAIAYVRGQASANAVSITFARNQFGYLLARLREAVG